MCIFLRFFFTSVSYLCSLPVAAARDDILAALRDGDVVVVAGETGSGKTTQVPQYLLDDAIAHGLGASFRIACAQPRRVAAVSVAERVAAERGEHAPGASGATVGYHVRLDAAVTSATRLLFCTTGVLLRKMAGDPALAGTQVVVVDEVHERTLQGERVVSFLFYFLSFFCFLCFYFCFRCLRFRWHQH
jgi:ATP-dependent RNA helicase DHX29